MDHSTEVQRWAFSFTENANPSRTCALCEHFEPSEDGDAGVCLLFTSTNEALPELYDLDADVTPQAGCAAWTPADDDDGEEEQDGDEPAGYEPEPD